MIRGTTPTLTYILPFDANAAAVLLLTFSQNGEEVFTVGKDDMDIKGKTVIVRLTQEQTLSLRKNVSVDMQFRALMRDDGETAIASKIIRANVGEILKDGVIE